MIKRFLLYILFCFSLLPLQGCLGPGNAEATSHMAYLTEINGVQQAVDAYKKATGVLPIKNSTPQTPIYEQNRIDFSRIVPEYIPQAPSNSYEGGGYFQYLIVNAESQPTVKVYDLTLVSTIQDIENKIQIFRYNKGYSPVGKILANGRYTIDFKAIGYKTPPHATSPYSGQSLNFFMDSQSTVYINYLPDIYNAVKSAKQPVKPGVDLRPLLYEDSPYVPVASVPYAVNSKGEVDFLLPTTTK